MKNKKVFKEKLKVAQNNIYRFEEKKILQQYDEIFKAL